MRGGTPSLTATACRYGHNLLLSPCEKSNFVLAADLWLLLVSAVPWVAGSSRLESLQNNNRKAKRWFPEAVSVDRAPAKGLSQQTTSASNQNRRSCTTPRPLLRCLLRVVRLPRLPSHPGGALALECALVRAAFVAALSHLIVRAP